MNATVEDLRPTIVPKSDQLNAEQLLGGPMVLKITDVRIGSGDDQPVVVHYEGENGRPYKPCKTMRKLLIHAYGPNGLQWIGKSLQVYNDPSVKFGGEDVGGIRISHMSDIPSGLKVSLTSTRGKKAKYEIKPLQVDRAPTLQDVLAAIQTVKGQRSMTAAEALIAKLPTEQQPTASRALAERVRALKGGSAAKTAADYIGQIDNATSAETAALVLDEAKDILPDAEWLVVKDAYNMAWTEGAK